MTVAPFIIDIFSVCLAVGFLHWHYGNWKRHQLFVTLVTLVAWTLPFMIIFALPIDVTVTFYDQCLQDNNITTNIPTTTMLTTFISGPTQATTSSSLIFQLNSNNTINTSSTIAPTSFPTTTQTNVTTTQATITTTTTPQPEPAKVCYIPWTYMTTFTLSVFWHVVYWTSQCLTWIWLPMMQSYAKAGEFTFLGKFKYALIVNAIYYGTYLVIFGCCLVYLAATSRLVFNLGQLKVLAITASNTWGLTLLVLLLGYGLVELPRSCWNASKSTLRLARSHFKVAKVTMEKIEAEEELEDVLTEVKRISQNVSSNNPLRKYVDIMVAKCPPNFGISVSGSGGRASLSSPGRSHFDRQDESHITEKNLAKLHRRLIVAKQRQSSTACQWRKLVATAIELEDVDENKKSSLHVFERSPAMGPYSGMFSFCFNAKIEWYWKCKIRPILLKIAAILMAVMSFMVVWSECLFFVKSPVLSLFAQFVDLAERSYGYHAIEFVCILTISYLSICTYYTIFKMRIFNYYYIVGPHETDENSMIFCGMLLCRLTPPLCLNFLGLIHLDSHITKENMVETAYTRFMGNLDVLPFISDGFNIYFPIAIVALCLLTILSVGTRLLHCLGFQQFIGDDDMTQEMIDEGVELIKRERRKYTRQEDVESRRRTWNERVNERDNSTINRRTAPRTGTDRSELLNEAEPMGYRSYDDNTIFNSDINRPSQRTSTFDPQPTSAAAAAPVPISGSYQRPHRNNILDPGPSYGSKTFVRPSTGPPRNIFDDV
ncbi:hypothetical protein HELRODRAFT_105627 [Helobdella robusta]|uniref:Uncharacterized protein n=1 Tax=Helobdella robusta TaxID=6412 RepID=T1EDW8_HELRO|nr:hypothetical protein HELRODRAFT_105627 [Helobdella robusta]ESO12929.1 hypothetical protein HELRODRAFT_105627 [Helobdella robusta]